MLDIVKIQDGADLGVADTIVVKAGNILSVQIGSLEYQPDFGVDLDFFLSNNFQFQTESFRSYMIERLTSYQINVAEVMETLNTLMLQYKVFVGDAAPTVKGLIK